MMSAVKRVLFAAVAGLAAAALAQADGGQRRRPARRRADAGVSRQKPVLLGTDPPGKLRPLEPSADGGVALADAGPDEVHRELQQLRARVDQLERERAQSQQSAQQLQQITQELQELRRQVADAEAQRQAEAEQAQARRASTQSAVDGLYAAQAQLAGGGYDVEAQLSRAESAFSGDAQRNVRLARTALQNRDLSAARAYLAAAIAAAQQGR
jgi:predicted component of type VI protein secretion system